MTKNNAKTVVVGMSGGVDSSVAAYILKNQGHNVIGVTMKIWDAEDGDKQNIMQSGCGISDHQEIRKSGCYGPGEAADIEAAQKVAKQLAIPHYVIDLHAEYQQAVLKYFRNEYLAGKTPNPCVVCNQKIKFGLLLDKVQHSGIDFDFFATGHYARVEWNQQNQKYLLKKSTDAKKDQSYFLYRLTQQQLAGVMFPLGSLLKQDVKKIASQIGLKNIADKPESQDFYDGQSVGDFFEAADFKSGDIVDTSGHIVGRHNGVIRYTIGQRKGLKIGGLKEPLYVIEIDINNNRLIVGPREKLFKKNLIAKNLNWVSIDAPTSPLKATARIRSTQPEKICTITPLDNNSIKVDFDEPQMAVTPGQSIVFYNSDTLLGGGVIK